MTNNDDRTIPFDLSNAEFESLRILRKRTNPTSLQDKTAEEEQSSPESNPSKAETSPAIPLPKKSEP